MNPELALYYCFGCQESGDAITFVRKLDGLDFPEAVERLAARAGITLRYDSSRASRRTASARARLAEAVAAAIDYYHAILLEQPAGGRARGYLRSRGFDGDAARRFVLGWSPDGYDGLSRHLYDLKFSARGHRGGRARVREPVEPTAGLVPVAAHVPDLRPGRRARRLRWPLAHPATGPKYKNTAETALYHKSRLLYGLNWAKAEIGARDEVVICEGYTDVMGFALAGVPNAVATCGTALTEQHVQLLKSFTRRDGAGLRRGQRGPERGGEVVPVGAAVRHRGEGRRAADRP